MNNEDTLYLNNEENQVQDTTNPNTPKAKKSGMSGKAQVAVAGAAGVAAGTVVGAGAVGVAVAANQNQEEPIAEAMETKTETATESNTDASDNIVVEAEPVQAKEEPQHVTHVTNNYYTTEVHNHPEPIAEVSTEEQLVTPVQQEIVADPVDNEVRIIGVETIHTPEGYQMDVVGVAVGDDPALLVDVDQDGYLEVFIHDDNKNGQIEENEVHDISDANIHMADLGVQMPHDDFHMASDETPIDNFEDPNIMPV